MLSFSGNWLLKWVEKCPSSPVFWNRLCKMVLIFWIFGKTLPQNYLGSVILFFPILFLWTYLHHYSWNHFLIDYIVGLLFFNPLFHICLLVAVFRLFPFTANIDIVGLNLPIYIICFLLVSSLSLSFFFPAFWSVMWTFFWVSCPLIGTFF